MRPSPAEYLSLRLCAHELLHGVPLYDVTVMDLPGGGAGRSVADIRALESAAAPSHIARGLYGVRKFLGRAFGWDRVQMRPEDSLELASSCTRPCYAGFGAPGAPFTVHRVRSPIVPGC